MARDIVAIGASAGGLQALKELFSELRPDLPASIFVVLHIDPNAGSLLPQILNRTSSLEVAHPRHGEQFKRGRIYLAPPDRHLRCQNGVVELDTGPKENRHRPAVDALFRSVAAEHGPRVIGVVLTGSLDDGTAGLWAIKKRGGIAVAQSPEDALYPSMPFSAIRNVEVDYIVPLREIAKLITSLCDGEGKTEKKPPGFPWESLS